MTLVVGLTGGIGSGKTLVSDYLAEHGVPIIDTDLIARQIVEPGQPALASLVTEFGDSILLGTGELNRAALRELAFSSSANKQKLDNITHPAIREETVRQVSQAAFPYCLVVVPLLDANSAFAAFLHRVVTVSTETEIRIKRVMARSSFTRDQVLQIMQTQLSDAEREQFADDVISNNGTKQEAIEQAAALHEVYLNLGQAMALERGAPSSS